MRKSPVTAVLLFCSLLTSALCAPLPGDERSWTGVNGATFVGVFTRTFDEGGVKKVQFITPVGKIITVAFENLSEEDRGIILAFESKAHSKPAPAAASGEAFKELPNANRTRIPKFKPDDFGGTDEESLVDALWVSLLWWDTTGIMTIPKSGDIEKKAEWLHKELSRYISKGGRGAATLEEAREGVHEYFEKRLEDTGACKGRIVKNVDPGTLAALAAGNDIVILDMTMTYSNSRNFSVTGVIESMQADGAFVMHLFGESFSGKMSPTTEVKPMNPGAKAYEFTLSDRDKMPDHYKTQGARFFIGDNAWNGSLVLKPYVYNTPGKKAPIPE